MNQGYGPRTKDQVTSWMRSVRATRRGGSGPDEGEGAGRGSSVLGAVNTRVRRRAAGVVLKLVASTLRILRNVVPYIARCNVLLNLAVVDVAVVTGRENQTLARGRGRPFEYRGDGPSGVRIGILCVRIQTDLTRSSKRVRGILDVRPNQGVRSSPRSSASRRG